MNWSLIVPELIITVAAFAVLIIDFLLPQNVSRRWLNSIGLLAVAAALAAVIARTNTGGEFYHGVFVLDPLAVFFKVIFLVAAFLVFLIARDSIKEEWGRGEFYWLALTALLGMMVTASARDLIAIYVGIELISLSFYGLVGYRKELKEATEAALKYFILGTFAIAFWLYGAALIFGATGATDLVAIAAAVQQGGPLILYLGLFFLLVGFGFKMGLAPFHSWLPDAYQGAPTPVTAFLAVGSKAAAFSVFIRVIYTAFQEQSELLTAILGILAVLTMTWGNVAALRQQNLKRLLAYSGIAHAGYLLVGMLAADVVGVQAIMFYFFGYLFANLGAFAVVAAVGESGGETMEDFQGLRWRNPYLALGMTICLLSLAGIPPLVGFLGKFYLFWGAMQKGGWILWVVIIAAINSAIALFYYVNVIRQMFFREGEEALVAPAGIKFTVAVASLAVVLGVFYFQAVVSGWIPAAGLLGALGLS